MLFHMIYILYFCVSYLFLLLGGRPKFLEWTSSLEVMVRRSFKYHLTEPIARGSCVARIYHGS